MNPWSFFFIGYVFSQPHFFREKVRPFPHLTKAVNNRIETESEENDYGTDKKEWSEINEDWRLCVWQMEGKSTARI